MKTLLLLIVGYIVLNLSVALLRLLIKYINSNFTNTVQFKIALAKGTSPGNGYYYLFIEAPFYDEKKHFYFGLNPLKFLVAFVPLETIPSA